MSETPWTFEQWFEWVRETADYDGHGEGELTYPLLSVSAELGEFSGLMVRWIRRQKGGKVQLNRNELTEEVVMKLAKEAYDVMHCSAFIIQELGLSVEDIIKIGREKLEKRLSTGSETASHRLDEKSIVGRTVWFRGAQRTVIAEFVDHVVLKYKKNHADVHVDRASFYREIKEVE